MARAQCGPRRLLRACVAGVGLLCGVGSVAPVGALSRTYMCFFDPGSAEPSPRCQQIMLEFVQAWDAYRRAEAPGGEPIPAATLRVEVEGHADRAERDAEAVSAARTRSVAAFLRLNDIPPHLITQRPYGSVRPLVPTDGDEPQNRRVFLILR